MPNETPALETPKAPVAGVLPESIQKTLPDQKADYGAADLFNASEPDAPAAPVEPKTETPAEPVVEVKTLASKWASKVKAPAADVAALVKPGEKKTEVKAEVVAEPVVEHPEDKMELPAGSSEKARDNFKVMKNTTKELRQQLAQREREMNELRSKPVTAPFDMTEFERLKAEHKEAMDRLLVLDTEKHPVFQSQYVKPRNEALQAATELLKAHGKDADLAALIEKPRGEIGKALAEILVDVPQFDQAEISANIRQAWKLDQDKKVALAKAKETKGAINQQDSQTHAHAFESKWSKVGGSLSESLELAEIPANATSEQRRAIEDYNQAMSLDSIKADARKIALEANSYDAIADASIKAVAYDRHMKYVMPRIGVEVNVMLDTIKALNKELEGYRSRNPNRDISPNVNSNNEPAKTENLSYEESAKNLFGKRR